MGVVKKTKFLPSKGTVTKTKTSSVEVSLPDEVSKVSSDLREYSILVHGEKKIGKTSLFAQEEGAFFLEFDPPQRALEIYQRHCPDWRTFLAYLDLLEKEGEKAKPKFKTIVVDGADIMYHAAFEHVCKRLGIEHPSDENDFGKSWGEIRKEFSRGVHRLLSINGMACRFICHSVWKETKLRGGEKISKLIPSLTGQAEEALVGEIDIWAAYVYDEKDRVLIIRGDEEVGAGNRVKERFKTTDNRIVQEIPMGSSPEEAYNNLLLAFDNKQSYATITEWRKSKEKKSVVKKKVVRL